MSERVTTILEVLGLALLAVGVGTFSIGAGVAVAGASCLAVGFFGSRP